MVKPQQSPAAIRALLSLGTHPWAHSLVAALRVYPAAGMLLRQFPLRRREKQSGLVYRLTALDHFSIEAGLFDHDEYRPVLSCGPFDSVIDLGCNAGWFVLWLSARTQHLPSQALLIDAHPGMAAEAAWHMTRNQVSGAVVVHGAVGMPSGTDAVPFHVHPSTSASSVHRHLQGKQLPAKGKVRTTTVPAVSVGQQWAGHFGVTQVDLVKLDIEGKELDFIAAESEFLRTRTRTLVVEWHKWCVTFAELNAALTKIGFQSREVFGETDLVGLAVYENRAKNQMP